MDDGSTRPEPPYSAEPLEMLGAFLDFHRATLLWKVSGLTDEQLRAPRTESGVSLLAVVKHCAWVERHWFQVDFAGLDVEMIWSKEDPDADWRLEPHETTDAILAFYRDECEKSREIVRGARWDDIAKRRDARRPDHSLGWIMTHMVEEVARHNGQVDVFRESIDGLTGE